MEATYQKEQGGALTCECHGEHHLPDYAGDMKKILSSSARILPAGKFIGGEEVQFGGAVCYDVWYLDSENHLTHEAFSTDYEFTFPRGNGTVDGIASVSVAHYTLRPSGPRRISAKAMLKAEACLRETATYSCESSVESATLHTLEKTVEVGHRIFSEPMERECGEEMPLPAMYARDAEIAFSEGSVHIDSVVAEENGVLVRGNYAVSVVLTADGLVPLRHAESYPLEEHIPLEGCVEDMAAMANGFFSSLTFNVRETEGEEPMLTFHGILELSASAEKNLPISVVADAFAEGGGTVCENDLLMYDVFGPAETLCRTVELCMPISEDAGDLDGVFYTTVSLKNEACTVSEREINYTADAEIHALCYTLDEAGMPHYSAEKQTVPFVLTLPLRAPLAEDARLSLEAHPGMCEGRLDENKICVECRMVLSIRSASVRKESCVRRITVEQRECGVFVPTYAVYYPTPTDSLWTIAKRYGVSPASIAACNHLTSEVSSVEERLPDMLMIDQRRA